MERNIYDMYPMDDISESEFRPGYLPDQLGDGNDPLWYINNIYYISQFYNQPTFNVSVPYVSPLSGFFETEAELGDFWSLPANRMLYYMTYGIGKQPNISFNHEVNNGNDGRGSTSLVKFTRGHDIQVMLENMVGSGLEMLEEMKMGADPMSPDAIGRVEEMADREILKFMISKLMDKFMKEYSNNDAPQDPEKQFKNLEDIKKWKSESIKDHLADTYLDIAKDIWTKCYWEENAIKKLRYGIGVGCSSTELLINNGYQEVIVHTPWNAVFDTNYDEDFGRKARIWGVFYPMTLTDLFIKYPQLGTYQDKDGKSAREVLNHIATTTNLKNNLNISNTNFKWWGGVAGSTPNFTDYTLTIGRAYWIGTKIVQGVAMPCAFTGTIIGNKYLVDFHPCDNKVVDPYQPYKVQMPGRQWTPALTMGIFNSFIARIHDLQDKADYYQFKIDEFVARAKGKIPEIQLAKLGYKSVKQLLDDVVTYGIIGNTDTGISDDYLNKQELVKSIDWTLGGDVTTIMNLKKEIISQMQTFIGQTKISLGQQTNYIGSKAAESNMEQSALGTNTLYKSWMYSILMDLRFQINQKKNLYAAGELEEEALTVVGKRGLNLLKKTKKKYCEDFGIYLRHNDRVSEDQRKQMLDFFKALVNQPNHGITPENFLDLLFTPTKSGMKDKYKAMADEQDQRAQRDMKARIEAEQAKQKAIDEKELKLASIDSQTQLTKAHLASETKKEIQDKKDGKDVGALAPALPTQPIQEPPPTNPAQTQQ